MAEYAAATKRLPSGICGSFWCLHVCPWGLQGNFSHKLELIGADYFKLYL